MIRNSLSSFKRNNSGNVAIMTALLMPILVAGAGFGAEAALWYHNGIKLQQTADKSVFAAAIDLRAGASSDTLKSTALEIAAANGFTAQKSTSNPIGPGWTTVGIAGADNLIVSNPPTSGAYAGNPDAIQVALQKFIPLSFSAMFIDVPMVENVKAVALIQTAGNACVLALSTTAPGSVSVGGNASLNLTGCNINSNSTASNAVSTSGSSTLSADCIVVVGGVSLNGGSTTQQCANTVTNTSAVADPYASLPVPTSSTTRPNSNGATLQPGVYPNGLNLTGTKTLQPGVYIVTGGSINVGANANITGSGITIYVANGVDVSMNANGYVNLSAPTSGVYSGVLFFGARDGTGSVSMNGTSASKLTGAIYFPNQDLSYNGNFSGNGGCMRVVAKTVSWSGNATIAQDCSAFGIANIPSQRTVMLVE